MTTAINLVNTNIEYPSADGEPVAETYLHLYAILTTLEVLKQYLAGRQATVLANQFLYYAQGFPKLRIAPDVMVIFDVQPGGRDNYKVWEEGQVPQVVFEMTSKGTQKQDQEQKKLLYEQLGILEYWLFDPKGEWVNEKLQGYRLQDEIYQPITDSLSQPLGLRLEVEGELLRFYRLDTGDKLLIPTELAKLAEQERQRAEQERQRAERERQRAERLAKHLRALGVDPESLS
ncbi:MULTISPECIES: Uma2 family endonuclease [Cyanophyceae]|uniref:Uma2 family endonuclease n=1 Tax=Cyanophyceae TaxID=3028117 RepID=UPI00232DA658|nr:MULTISPECIES: Uma2 family endonuclease [Cyanophyceae]MDB9358346.1 Uma2 family endonuclease [Nodularia spumigena CS-587/03]MDB9319770.1 Uma2 family endonuclease [Nodularia spumigena CS-590/01A]MDB9323793.1 Uma2 family endonuclease [Nodularia spumigena CS-591/07A]MDB9324678.1 Uma2 family endonuclease [Nodularia spumigena CS-590/02]MDB9331830.1 Uma2 family endonuclease [Nodularia spumigena CS-591/04]